MLKRNIINLIQYKREGSYWDFKAEYHKDKAELLHDMICLSGNDSLRMYTFACLSMYNTYKLAIILLR